MIGKLFEYFVGSLFISIATYYVAIKITERKFELFKWNVLKWILLESLVYMTLYIFNSNSIFRLLANVLILTCIYQKLFNHKFFKNVLLSFMFFSLILFSELIVLVINMNIYGFDINNFKDKYFMTILTNFNISIIIFILVNLKPIIVKYQKLFNEINMKIDFSINFIIFSSIFCLSLLLYYIYFDIDLFMGVIVNVILSICYISFPVFFLKERNNNYKLKLEYETILKNIENYEADLDEQRMKNHENKNILISIKGMINKNDKEIINFINEVINDDSEDDQSILFITKNIPTGGLQGLIYQKVLYMKHNNISYFVDINKNLNKKIFNNLSINNIKDICLVVGIFIDNAIQAVEKTKNKNVGIQMYNIKDDLIIEISNNYDGILEINNFGKKGFTTKSNGHGYGLSLVEEIIRDNVKMENKREINANVFVQKLILKK